MVQYLYGNYDHLCPSKEECFVGLEEEMKKLGGNFSGDLQRRFSTAIINTTSPLYRHLCGMKTSFYEELNSGFIKEMRDEIDTIKKINAILSNG